MSVKTEIPGVNNAVQKLEELGEVHMAHLSNSPAKQIACTLN